MAHAENQNIKTRITNSTGGLLEQKARPLVTTTAEAAARDDDAQRLVHGLPNRDLDGLVVGSEGVGEVGQRLAMINDRLSADLERQDALLLAVRLLAERVDDGLIFDRGAHRVLVHAGAEDEVVDENCADLLAQEVVVERGVALGLVSGWLGLGLGFCLRGLPARKRQRSGWG